MMGDMTTTNAPEQLTMLPAPQVPIQFRLDEATRRRGLQHVAAIRRMLEASARSRAHTDEPAERAPATIGERRAA